MENINFVKNNDSIYIILYISKYVIFLSLSLLKPRAGRIIRVRNFRNKCKQQCYHRQNYAGGQGFTLYRYNQALQEIY